MLVVVKYWYLQNLLQLFFYYEAAGSAYVLKVDASEDWLNSCHSIHDNRRVLGCDGDWKCVNVCEVLEEYGLSFHHGD
jgi:hypothetical protein